MVFWTFRIPERKREREREREREGTNRAGGSKIISPYGRPLNSRTRVDNRTRELPITGQYHLPIRELNIFPVRKTFFFRALFCGRNFLDDQIDDRTWELL